MKRHVAASLAVLFLVAAGAGVAHALTLQVGAVTLGADDKARLHVLNAEGGTVDVELVLADSATNTLLSTKATLALGGIKTLDIKGSDVPGGIVVASVIASNATSPSTCHPIVTFQVVDGGKNAKNNAIFATARVVPRGLSDRETGATQALRTLAKAQSLFFEAGRSRGTSGYASSLAELAGAGLIPAAFAVSGYGVEFVVGLHIFQVLATPITRTGDRAFFVDETGVVRASDVPGTPFSGCEDPAAPLGN